MHKIVYLVFGALVAAGASATGCGGSGGNTGGGNTGGAGTAGHGNGGSPANGGGGSNGNGGTSANGGGGTGGGAHALSCEDYCADEAKSCTKDLLQFTDTATCVAVCKSYPVGKTSDMAGDTLGCRTYHVTVAGSSPTNAKTHCWHSGPTGGDDNNTDTTEGVCGDACEAFCDLEAVACTGADQQYASKSECMTACHAFPKPVAATYDVATAVASHDFFCYMYHLNAAAVDPTTHCQHTKVGNSPPSPCEAPTP